MVIDKYENLKMYLPLAKGLDTALEYLESVRGKELEAGRHEIDGGNVFVMIQDYVTKPEEGAFFEAHRQYIDLQLMVKGRELMNWAPLCEIKDKEVSEEFSKGGDIAFYNGETKLAIQQFEDYFVLFFPDDAHMPCLQLGEPEKVLKIVIKIKIQ
ncbi:MAG: YhcH/YjgK/YiaL family protein [Oscillospiraceae bacterium]|nr:YhcH/YjgK/YiaL family protein [Oscillospiraceae bacterium]